MLNDRLLQFVNIDLHEVKVQWVFFSSLLHPCRLIVYIGYIFNFDHTSRN